MFDNILFGKINADSLNPGFLEKKREMPSASICLSYWWSPNAEVREFLHWIVACRFVAGDEAFGG